MATCEDPVTPKIAIFMSTSGHSGVDRAMRNLIPALASRGYKVDLLKVRRHGPELHDVPPNVRVLDTGAATTYAALPYLIRYLKQERPAVLLGDKDRVNRTALIARWLAGRTASTRLVLSSGTTISIDLQHRGWLERWIQRCSMRYLYPEPPRKSRRLHNLREWSHGKSIEVFPGDAGASGSAGAGASNRA